MKVYVVDCPIQIAANSADEAQEKIDAALSLVFDAGPVRLTAQDGSSLDLVYANAPEAVTENHYSYDLDDGACTFRPRNARPARSA